MEQDIYIKQSVQQRELMHTSTKDENILLNIEKITCGSTQSYLRIYFFSYYYF